MRGATNESNLAMAIALTIPFLETVLGSSFVFFLKRAMSELAQKALLGLAAGVMIAASEWSLLIPAIENAESQGVTGWVPATVGLLLGIGLLLAIDHPHQHLDDPQSEGLPCRMKKPTMLIFAVASHNLPEGMAVGVVLAGFLSGEAAIALAGVVSLAVGIAIQNIPEGAVISMSLVSCGLTRRKAFLYGVVSGAWSRWAPPSCSPVSAL